MPGAYYNAPEVIHDASKAPEVYRDPHSQAPYIVQSPPYDGYSDKQAQARVAYQSHHYLPLDAQSRPRGVPLIWVLSALALLIGIGAGVGIGYGAFNAQKSACLATSSAANNNTNNIFNPSGATAQTSATAITTASSVVTSAVATTTNAAGVPTTVITSVTVAVAAAAPAPASPTPESQCSDSQSIFKSNLTGKVYTKSCDNDIPNSAGRKDLAANFVVWSFDECIAICDGANKFNTSANMNTAVYSYGGVGQNGNQPAGSCYCLAAELFFGISYKGINLARLKT